TGVTTQCWRRGIGPATTAAANETPDDRRNSTATSSTAAAALRSVGPHPNTGSSGSRRTVCAFIHTRHRTTPAMAETAATGNSGFRILVEIPQRRNSIGDYQIIVGQQGIWHI